MIRTRTAPGRWGRLGSARRGFGSPPVASESDSDGGLRAGRRTRADRWWVRLSELECARSTGGSGRRGSELTVQSLGLISTRLRRGRRCRDGVKSVGAGGGGVGRRVLGPALRRRECGSCRAFCRLTQRGHWYWGGEGRCDIRAALTRVERSRRTKHFLVCSVLHMFVCVSAREVSSVAWPVRDSRCAEWTSVAVRGAGKGRGY